MKRMFLRLSVFVTASALAALGFGFVSAAAASASTHIFNNGSDSCLSSLGAGVGAKAKLSACKPSGNQTWSVTTTSYGTNTYHFTNVGDSLCLSDDGDLGTGMPVYMATCDGSANQVFLAPNGWALDIGTALEPYGDELLALSSLGDSSDGAIVYQATVDGSNNQEWVPDGQ